MRDRSLVFLGLGSLPPDHYFLDVQRPVTDPALQTLISSQGDESAQRSTTLLTGLQGWHDSGYMTVTINGLRPTQ